MFENVLSNGRLILVGTASGLIILVLTFVGVLFIVGKDADAWRRIGGVVKGAICIGTAPALAAFLMKISK